MSNIILYQINQENILNTPKMSLPNNIRKKSSQRLEEVSDDEDDLDQFEEENSFEERNNLYELRSENHTLAIQLRKMKIAFEAALGDKDIYIHELQLKNQKLLQQKHEISQLLKQQMEEKQQLKQQFAANRKTAQFHKSNQYGDPTEFIEEMMKKDKLIESLNSKVKEMEEKGSNKEDTFYLQQNNRLRQKVKILKEENQLIKDREDKLRRESEEKVFEMEKISATTHKKEKLAEEKQREVERLHNQVQESFLKMEAMKREINKLTDSHQDLEMQNQRLKVQYKSKEEKLIEQFQSQKQEIGKGMNENIRRKLNEKQEKIMQYELQKSEIEKQLKVLKQQSAIINSQISSLKQFNQYLENSNKNHEESKLRLQKEVSEKEMTIANLRQQHILQLNQVKKGFFVEKNALNEKIRDLEEELMKNNFQLEKLAKKEKDFEQQKRQMKLNKSVEQEKEKLVLENQRLKDDVRLLRQRYDKKSQTLVNMQKRIKQQYKERLEGLENQLHKIRKQSQENNDTESKEQLLKLKKLYEISLLDNDQKDLKIQKLDQQLKDTEKKFEGAEKEKNNLREDLKNFQQQYDQLNDKYKRMIELQSKIEEMTHEIETQRKKHERRRNEYENSEEMQASSIQKYKQRIRQLEDDVEEEKLRNKQNIYQMQIKIDKLTNEITNLNRQKSFTSKTKTIDKNEREKQLERDKEKLQQYVRQLEENNEILNKKMNRFEMKEVRQDSKLEKQYLELKVDYSESLRQTNMILQKYKKLQEIHHKNLQRLTMAQSEYDKINEKYVQIYKEKNKLIEELKSAYDQVNKLNLVLMSKEEELSKSRIQYHSNYESKYIPTNGKERSSLLSYRKEQASFPGKYQFNNQRGNFHRRHQ